MVNTPGRSQRSIRPGYSSPLPNIDDMSDDSDLASLQDLSQEATDNTDNTNNTNTNTNAQNEEDEDFILVPRDSNPHTPAATAPNRATSLSPMLQRDAVESALHPDPQWDVTPPSLRRTFQGGVRAPATPNSGDGLSPAREVGGRDAPFAETSAEYVGVG
ncbi:hypothetical protein PRZ48_002512 [Zasmidium cellare]|uniref:Uncharacterized protein n=1 Tax=Zasmidium cellare TaxID=395010 RepID=A0ABR0F5X0_ZASCE|nr:hypothetical protein PRZ48_002512 [Zasmidium cellare]